MKHAKLGLIKTNLDRDSQCRLL